MGLRDVLFGRKQLKDAAGERLFAISTARITLETELDLRSTGAAGVCFKPLSAGEFVRAENELQQLLDAVAVESGSKLERHIGRVRVRVAGRARRRLRGSRDDRAPGRVRARVARVRPAAAGRGLPVRAQGLRRRRVYWIYGFKRGTFWPFVPKGEDKERDNAEELELKAKLEQELPVEQDLALVRRLRRV